MTTNVEEYFADGCGRCALGGTPQCKVHTWAKELAMLRKILLDCGVNEESKWGMPCYTFQGKNVVMLSALKDSCTLGFFKGALMADTEGILTKPGENAQASRMLRFTNVQDIADVQETIKNYIFEAIEIERAGMKVAFSGEIGEIPDELHQKFAQHPALETAFYALTPGRQRGYVLHFSQPKQSATRTARIEKCMQMILDGIGINDAYKSGKKA